MRAKYRYDPERDCMVGEDGLPMLNQAQRAAPPVAAMVISDTQPPLASMTNGKVYDSKSELRKEYRRAGVQEIGNEKQAPKVKTKEDRKKQREGIKASLHKAHSRMGFGAV